MVMIFFLRMVSLLNFSEEQDNTVRTKRELGPGSNVSFLHHHANDGIPSQNNITNTQLGSIIPTPHEECSVGWKCLELGNFVLLSHKTEAGFKVLPTSFTIVLLFNITII